MNSNNKSSGGRQARKGNTPQKKNSFRKDFKKPRTTPQKVDVGGIRLNKFISNSGICSRREADTYIEHGSVTVNGKLVTEMGYKVQKTDEVRFDGTSITPEKKKYVLLGINLPIGTSLTPISMSLSTTSMTTGTPAD